MTLATVTSVPTTDASVVKSGGVSVFSNSAMVNGSGSTIHTADTVTITFSGRSLWAVLATDPTFGYCTVSIDGAAPYAAGSQGINPLPGINHQMSGLASQKLYRVLAPLARDLSDGPHTCVIAGANPQPIVLDSLLVVTGPRGTPTYGNAVVVGDSLSTGGGANVTTSGKAGYPEMLGLQLSAYLRRSINLIRKGAGGDNWHATDGLASGDASRTGGMWRIFADAAPNAPEFLTFLFGTNDLRYNAATAGQPSGPSGVGMADFARHIEAALMFCEDVFDVSQMRVAVGTPPHLSSWASWVAPNAAGAAMSAFDEAVAVVHNVVAQFPWCAVALVSEDMDRRDNLVFPNGLADLGVHPNDHGHGVIAQAFVRALLGGIG